MAAGQFGDLTAGARAAVPFIQSGVARGLSGNRIIAELKAAGTSARRSDVLTIARTLRGERSAGLRVANIRRDFRPDPSRIPVRKKTRRQANFTYRVEVEGINRWGEKEVRRFGMGEDRLNTRGWLDDRAEDIAKEWKGESEMTELTVKIIGVWQRGGPVVLGP